MTVQHTNNWENHMIMLMELLPNISEISPKRAEYKFDIHMSVHRNYNSKLQPTRCDVS